MRLLVDGTEEVHAAGFLHRDIKPCEHQVGYEGQTAASMRRTRAASSSRDRSAASSALSNENCDAAPPSSP
jgi:hypothetical protein